ncbi:MAG: hypothetical protein GX122_05185 [Candidatus Cloacimonetes bacterium]|nr:hypothetical protein [Candidatus Cloacimonadota bacterium]NLO11801.1 hypothetical protein [Candidatus Cloacimonadota bacterium]
MKHLVLCVIFVVFIGILNSEEVIQSMDTQYDQMTSDSLDTVYGSEIEPASSLENDVQINNTITDEEQEIITSKQTSNEAVALHDDSDRIENPTTEEKSHVESKNKENQSIVIMLIILAAAVLLFYIIGGIKRKCRKCGRMWAAKEISTPQVLERWMGTKEKRITEEILDNSGQKRGSIVRDDTVPVSYAKVLHTYRCKYCKAVWRAQKNHENWK